MVSNVTNVKCENGTYSMGATADSDGAPTARVRLAGLVATTDGFAETRVHCFLLIIS